MTRSDLRKTMTKILAVAAMIASFTPTPRDDQAVALLQGVIGDDDKWDEFCDVLGLPPDAPTPSNP